MDQMQEESVGRPVFENTNNQKYIKAVEISFEILSKI